MNMHLNSGKDDGVGAFAEDETVTPIQQKIRFIQGSFGVRAVNFNVIDSESVSVTGGLHGKIMEAGAGNFKEKAT